MMIVRRNEISLKVLEVLKQNPGISGRDLRTKIKGHTRMNVDTSIQRLRTAGYIENRGKHGLASAWYLIDNGDFPFLEEARILLDQIAAQPIGARGVYLARHLAALTDGRSILEVSVPADLTNKELLSLIQTCHDEITTRVQKLDKTSGES